MITFDETQQIIVVALYRMLQASHQATYSTAQQIVEQSGVNIGAAFVARACDSLIDMGHVEARKSGGTADRYTLNDSGFRWAEELITKNAPALSKSVPASDRLVTIGHNQPDYGEIEAEISKLAEDVRAWNGNPEVPAERSRLLEGLEAAKHFWAASELKVIQLKVGIILAIEDAQKALGTAAKMVGGKLLIDAIKGFIKTHSGIDLDHL